MISAASYAQGIVDCDDGAAVTQEEKHEARLRQIDMEARITANRNTELQESGQQHAKAAH